MIADNLCTQVENAPVIFDRNTKAVTMKRGQREG